MKEYQKIETVFSRDMNGSKKLVEGIYRNETVEYLKDNKWVFTEKIDGTNIRVYWDGHKVNFGGRTDNAQIPAILINRLNDLFGGETNSQIFEEKFGESEVTLFGEGYGAKIQSGGLIFFTKTNENEPKQNECYSVLDYNSSEYIMCEMESGK